MLGLLGADLKVRNWVESGRSLWVVKRFNLTRYRARMWRKFKLDDLASAKRGANNKRDSHSRVGSDQTARR